MVTVILDETNRVYFKNLVSPDIYKLLGNRSYLAIGAVYEDIDYSHTPGMAAGALVAEIGSEIEITWMYVAPDSRGMGAGDMLLGALIRAAKRIGAGNRVFSVFTQGDGDTSIQSFLINRGFDIDAREGACVYEVTVGAMMSSVEAFRPPDMKGVLPLEKLPEVYLKKFNAAFKGGAMVAPPVKPEDYLPCSTCLVREGAICGLFLFQAGEDGHPVLVYGWARGRNDLAGLLFGSTKLLSRAFEPDTVVELSTMNSVSRAVALGLGTEANVKQVYMASMGL